MIIDLEVVSMWIPRKRKNISVRQHIQRLVSGILVPLILVIVLLVGVFLMLNQQYQQSVKNAQIAAQFNIDFRIDVDLKVSNYVTGLNRQNELPYAEVGESQTLINNLKESTSFPESQWYLKNMTTLSENLKMGLDELADTVGYSNRMKVVTNKISNITYLIESNMQRYIFIELQRVSVNQSMIHDVVVQSIVVSVVLVVLLIIIILHKSLRIAHQISNPIDQLYEKVKHYGLSSYTDTVIQTKLIEIQNLDSEFQRMDERILELIQSAEDHQKQLNQIEYELLQSQINPHFLYNTFDTVIWLAEMNDQEKVISTIGNLSIYFRNSLSNGQNIIPLKVELEQMESYLAIQKVRYGDFLNYKIINEHVDVDTIKIPKLTLQPLIENAIYHGLKNKRQPGLITILIESEVDAISIKVYDNGVGMEERDLDMLRRRIAANDATSLGLINVQRRLKLYYGNHYGLSFDSIYNEGFCVSVLISKESPLNS